MKIELKMSDGTEITMEDSEDVIDVEFARWQYEEGSDRNYIKNRFLIQFKTDTDLNQFVHSLHLISREFENED